MYVLEVLATILIIILIITWMYWLPSRNELVILTKFDTILMEIPRARNVTILMLSS